jgi:hypothetical protein
MGGIPVSLFISKQPPLILVLSVARRHRRPLSGRRSRVRRSKLR